LVGPKFGNWRPWLTRLRKKPEGSRLTIIGDGSLGYRLTLKGVHDSISFEMDQEVIPWI